MPNQYYPRGFFGYPYPQQNFFMPGMEGYPQYPYMNAGMLQMPSRPYMQNMPYGDPSQYYPRQQFDYSVPQPGYAIPGPYDFGQPMSGPGVTPIQPPFNAYPPAYASPWLQTPYYGMDLSQQAYIPSYQVPNAPQYAPYLNATNQYWQDYQAAPQVHPYHNEPTDGQNRRQSGQFEEIGGRYRPDFDPNAPSSYQEPRPARPKKARRDDRKRDLAKKQQEKFRREAAAKEVASQRKRKAVEEAARQEAMLEQKLREMPVMSAKPKQEAPLQQDPKTDYRKSPTKATAVQNPEIDKATAAAAASIAAFHEAAKSANEINLNEVTKALKPNPESGIASSQKDAGHANDNAVVSEEVTKSKVSTPTGTEESVTKTVSDTIVPGISDSTKIQNAQKDAKEEKEDIKENFQKESAEQTSSKTDKEPLLSAQNEAVSEEKGEDSSVSEKPDENKASEEASKNDGTDVSTEDETGADKLSVSPLAIVGLVFGICGVALAACAPFFSLFGYAAIVVGALALIISVIALFRIKNKSATGKPLAIIGVVCGIVAIVAAIVLHFFMAPEENVGVFESFSVVDASPTNNLSSGSSSSSVYGIASSSSVYGSSSSLSSQPSDVQNSSSSVSGTTGSADSSSSNSISSSMDITPTGNYKNLSVGTPVTYSNGLTVKVDSVKTGLTSSSGKQIVCVTVSYNNNGSSSIDYNSFDWKVQGASSALKTYTIYPNGENELNSGELPAGGSVTGNLYFEAPVTTIIYEANYWNSDSNATWKA